MKKIAQTIFDAIIANVPDVNGKLPNGKYKIVSSFLSYPGDRVMTFTEYTSKHNLEDDIWVYCKPDKKLANEVLSLFENKLNQIES